MVELGRSPDVLRPYIDESRDFSNDPSMIEVLLTNEQLMALNRAKLSGFRSYNRNYSTTQLYLQSAIDIINSELDH